MVDENTSIPVKDIKAFSADNFNTKDWINETYRTSNKDESKQTFVKNTLSALELCMQQLNNSLEETTSQVISSLPRIIRESREVEISAKELCSHADKIEEALTAAQQAAGHPLLSLQRTDKLKSKLEMARQELQEADKWANLTSKLEGILESNKNMDLNNIAKLLEDMNECLEMLAESSDYEDKILQLDGLKNRLEAALSPAVVESFTGQQTEKCKEFWKIFSAMGRKEALSIYRARCEDGALRSRLPCGISVFIPSSLRDLHAIFLRHASHQLDWAPTVCPSEETVPLLIRLYTSVLTEIMDIEKNVEVNTKDDSSASHLNQLSELLAACDFFVSEVVNIITREQGKKGNVSDTDLKQFGYIVYAPIRLGLKRLGRLLISSMSTDLGTLPNIESQTSDAGTILQLRITRGLRTLTSNITLGKTLSRGSAPLHLLYAIQWLIEEICMGWNVVNNLAGCLSLMKAAVQLQNLVTQANEILEDTKEDKLLMQKRSHFPEPLKNWKILLKTDFAPIVSSFPLNTTPDKFCKELRQKTLDLVLTPISTHLDCMDKLQGWSNNDQHVLDLPDFSLSPQEYITQVGQYLINLPQHLEPLLDHGEISATEEDPAYQFLNEVCNTACKMFILKINSIGKMDAMGIKKCSTDIAYLSSVLEELEAGSLGIQLLSETLTNLQAS